MIRNVAFIVGLFLAGSAMADVKDDLAQAIKKLGDAENYSWKNIWQHPNGSSSFNGKTNKAGFSIFVYGTEMPNDVAVQGGKTVLNTEKGWRTAKEVAADRNDGYRANQARQVAQAFKPPAAEAEDLASRARNLREAEGALAGDLPEADAKSLLIALSRRVDSPQVANAKATVMFWLKDGMLANYRTHVTGRIKVSDQECDVDYTVTVEIKDVGSTKLDLPEEAKKKLG